MPFATRLGYLCVELRQRHLLLVLDNFEQVLAARPRAGSADRGPANEDHDHQPRRAWHGRRAGLCGAVIEHAGHCQRTFRAGVQRLPNGKQLAWAHYNQGQIMLAGGAAQQGAAHFAESARLWANRTETLAVAYCESGVANCYFNQGWIAQARTLYQATLDVFRRFEVQHAVAWSLWNLAHAAAAEGDDDCVTSALQESLAIFQSRHDEQGIADCEAALRGTWGPAHEPFRK